MKTTLAMRFTVFGAIALFVQSTVAQVWQTVDDFVSGSSAQAYDICKDPFGNIYVAGSGERPDSPENYAAVVRKSSDGGNTWTIVDFFDNGTGPAPEWSYWWEFYGITCDASGILYAVGDEYETGTWLVRRSLDGGLTWQTVDLFPGEARAVTTDPAGNVYVAGQNVGANVYLPGDNGRSWIIRKSSNGGVSWSTVDTFASSRVRAVFSDSTGRLFAVGSGSVTTTGKGNKTTTQRYSYVRRSIDAGATWTTVDTVAGASAANVGADAFGNHYVVGNNGSQWMLRKSVNGGASFASVDNFTCVTTSTRPLRTECVGGTVNDFAADAFGNLFAVGAFGTLGYAYTYAWGVRENPGGIGAWQTVDALPNPSPYQSANQSIAFAAVADNAGNVFVAGWTHYGDHWVVRKLPAP